jgi:HSP20 family protein
MALMRYTPTHPRLRNRWDNLFDEFFGNGAEESTEMQRVWRPRVDVSESESEVRVQVDLPGIRKEDVSITLENGVLTISGERKEEEEKRDENMHFSERVYGHFSRSFTVNEAIDQDNIEATVKDGVLTVVLPKVEKAKPKKIEVK